MTETHGRLIAFDIDDCLMPVNRAPEQQTRAELLALQRAGAHLVFASGKPCLYLSGLVRGLDVMGASLIGENGAEIWVTSTMPPQRLMNELSEDELSALRSLKEAVLSRYGDRVFFQPNAVGVTAFPVSDDFAPSDIVASIDVVLPSTISMYVHVDSVDWAVKRFDKGVSLRGLAAHLGIPMSLVAAVGDGSNDLPMLEVASLALWLGDQAAADDVAVVCVKDIHEAMERLLAFVAA